MVHVIKNAPFSTLSAQARTCLETVITQMNGVRVVPVENISSTRSITTERTGFRNEVGCTNCGVPNRRIDRIDYGDDTIRQWRGVYNKGTKLIVDLNSKVFLVAAVALVIGVIGVFNDKERASVNVEWAILEEIVLP